MGDGRRLKEILDEKGINVRQMAKRAGLTPSTLYAIVQKDSNIRFDWALRIANELDIDVNEICSASPFSGELKEDEVYPTIKDTKGLLDATRVKGYLKQSLYPLMMLYGKVAMPDVDHMLTTFYELDDEARQEVREIMDIKRKTHADPERVKDIKNIKGW
jgi:transcriptional regulator with XRE-family HTH domain